MADPSSSLGNGAPPVYNLNIYRSLCYCVGHVLNDLCASMWFSYLLVFFHKVLMFSNQMAGYVMLLGQVSDAICTPFIGYESDRTRGCGKYGQRKTWHLLGCVCVLCSFPFIFLRCPRCEHADTWAQFIYYAPFVVIYQFGWGSTQISHLSLIPELTASERKRVELNAIRYAFTVISSITVYAAAWLFLGMGDDDKLASSDALVFRNLALMVIGLGVVFVFIFHVGTKEHAQDYNKRQSQPMPAIRDEEKTECTAALTNNAHVKVTNWLKEHQFYQVALVYMFTRLTVNLSQIYMPLYLTESLLLPKNYIAIVPLVVYISGFLTSLFMKIVNRLIGRKLTYIVGAAMVISSSIWFYFLTNDSTWHVIFPAILLGAGNSTILVTSLSILADLIGNNTSSGAFVYGCMGFAEKISNGVAVVLIQNLQPCPDSHVCCADCVWYYQYMMAFVPSSMALLCIMGILSLSCMTIGDLSMFRAIPHDQVKDERNAGCNKQINQQEDNSQMGEDCCRQGDNVQLDEDPRRQEVNVQLDEDPRRQEDSMQLDEDPCRQEDKVQLNKDPPRQEDNIQVVEDPRRQEDDMQVVEDSCQQEDNVPVVEDPRRQEDDMQVVEDPRRQEDDMQVVEDSCQQEDNVPVVEDPRRQEDNVQVVEDSCQQEDNVPVVEDPRRQEDNVQVVEDSCQQEDNVPVVEDPRRQEDDIQVIEDAAANVKAHDNIKQDGDFVPVGNDGLPLDAQQQDAEHVDEEADQQLRGRAAQEQHQGGDEVEKLRDEEERLGERNQRQQENENLDGKQEGKQSTRL